MLWFSRDVSSKFSPVDYVYIMLSRTLLLIPPFQFSPTNHGWSEYDVRKSGCVQYASTSTNRSSHQLPKSFHPTPKPPKKNSTTRPSQKEKTLTIDADCPSDSARCRADIRRPRRPAWAHTAPAPPPSSGRVATMALPEGRKTCCRGRRGCRPKPGQR